MKRLSSRVRWIGGGMAVALALTSFLANSVQTVQDKQKVATMTHKMKTVCVGRFLIDLPADASVHLGRGFVGGYRVSSTDTDTDDDFSARLHEFETAADDRDPLAGPPRVESVKPITSNAAWGKVYTYNRRPARAFEGKRIVDIEDVKVQGMLRFPQASVMAYADGMALDSGDKLARLLGRLRPIAPGVIPREQGFCLEHAIVRDPFEHRGNEGVAMFAGLPGHPDINIVLSSMAGTDPAPGLLARHATSFDTMPAFMRLAFTRLREHARTINGLTGDELVMRVLEPNFTTGYSFQWEMAGKQEDVHAPLLTLELDAGTNPVSGGKPVQSTLSEEALFDLWERIAGSIRLRPAELERQAQPAQDPVAIGARIHAGESCPHSGWWQCRDGNAELGVLGGQRQYVRQGQRMPQALLLPQQTMWERLRGVQPSYESSNPTLWMLQDKRLSARLPSTSALEAALPGTQAAMPAGANASAHLQTPIGSVANTGAACPASGWWRCEDASALDGTRWFAAGSLLPAATFRARPHGRGVPHPQHIHRRSAWTLVRRADGDPAPAPV